ncbi:MAG: hypothetical protein IKH57_16300 [Clostridia bacterium]|nr:hypothetical protein [Clostridia bacterium]
MKKICSVFLALCLLVSALPALAEESVQNGEFPIRFDLRDRGVVTPVKKQSPWGACWAFGGIAAAETSIMSSLDLTCEEYKELQGEDFDLSEKHLVWFAMHLITALTSSSQAGEGIYLNGKEDDPSAVYSIGGTTLYVTTLFSTGVGPVEEKLFPYHGKEGLTEIQFIQKYPEAATAHAVETIEGLLGLTDVGLTLKQIFDEKETQPDLFMNLIASLQAQKLLDESLTVDSVTFRDIEEMCYGLLIVPQLEKAAETENIYSRYDDWTIPETDGDGHPNRDLYSGFTLIDGNILPPLSVKEDGKWVAVNDAGTRAVKSELLKGHGVAVSLRSDQSMPGDPVKENGYMNTATWAHYTFNDEDVSHGVCIVGWDDTYSRENFREGHQPPADGAWIVKNSWGSETDCEVLPDGTKIGEWPWGIRNEEGKATGYFYLSYYDKSVSSPESMVFGFDLYQAGGDMSVWAYDYMPSTLDDDALSVVVQDGNVIKTANVFTNESDREYALYGISTKTASPRARVKYTLYRLSDSAQNPEDGTLIGKRLAYYDYAGFHREALNGSITIQPGERIAVIVTETVTDSNGKEQYEYAANQAYSQKYALAANGRKYGVSVVNKGESFIYENGKWTDWTEYEMKLSDALLAQFAKEGIEASPDLVVTDNFSIKLYVVAGAGTEPLQ